MPYLVVAYPTISSMTSLACPIRSEGIRGSQDLLEFTILLASYLVAKVHQPFFCPSPTEKNYCYDPHIPSLQWENKLFSLVQCHPSKIKFVTDKCGVFSETFLLLHVARSIEERKAFILHIFSPSNSSEGEEGGPG